MASQTDDKHDAAGERLGEGAPVWAPRLAWLNLWYLILVILWGAWVRITGSGAGCGTDWPTCHGEVVPLSPTAETVIEYTHRLTSGLATPLTIAMLVVVARTFGRKHRATRAAWLSFFFLLAEAAVGAGLVHFELVAGNTSVARALTASFHLVNTFLLTGFSLLAAYWASRAKGSLVERPKPRWDFLEGDRLKFGLVIVGLLLASMTGAITALGDSLFPTSVPEHSGLFEHIASHTSPTNHFLVRLRIVHPILAVGIGLYLAFIAFYGLASLDEEDEREASASGDGPSLGRVREAMRRVGILTVVQLSAGIVNILIGAPGWMQILHLLLAVLLWLSVLQWILTLATPAVSTPHGSTRR